MDKNEEIINSTRYIIIEMNKSIVSDDNINMYYDKHKQFSSRWIMPPFDEKIKNYGLANFKNIRSYL